MIKTYGAFVGVKIDMSIPNGFSPQTPAYHDVNAAYKIRNGFFTLEYKKTTRFTILPEHP